MKKKFRTGDIVRINDDIWENRFMNAIGVVVGTYRYRDLMLYYVATEKYLYGETFDAVSLERVKNIENPEYYKQMLKTSKRYAYELDNPDYYETDSVLIGDHDNNVSIHVAVYQSENKTPFLNVYNDYFHRYATKVAKLHIKDDGIEIREHYPPWVETWNLTEEDMSHVIALLTEECANDPGFNYWQEACYDWNFEHSLLDDMPLEEYMSGKYDEEMKDNPLYVTSAQPMPKWKIKK